MNGGTFPALVKPGVIAARSQYLETDAAAAADLHLATVSVLSVEMAARVDGPRNRLVIRVILPADGLRGVG